MNNEFKKIKNNNETRYVLETMTAGGTGASNIATASGVAGKMQKRPGNILAQEADKQKVPAEKPRNFVAKNAKMGGAGAHKDKKKAAKQGDTKHKKPFMEELQGRIEELKSKLAEAEKNPHTSALGKALYRDLSKEKKASPAQVQRNKERWAKRQAEREQGVAEGLVKDIKRLATGKDVKTRAGQEISKAQQASMTGDNKTAHKHFKRYDKLDKLANKEQGVAEGYREYDELRDRVEQILMKAYQKYGTRDEIIDAAKPAAQQVAQQMGLEKYFDDVWSNALAGHDVDTNFGDNDDDFDYTDYSMRKGERGMEEGASDYVGNAIEDLRVSKPGMDRETFLDELYFYLDAQYGKQAADSAFAREDDAQFDEWYADYTDMAEADAYMESLARSLQNVLSEKAPPGDKYERMVKHIKKGYAKDGKATDKEKSIAYATAWKAKNKSKK